VARDPTISVLMPVRNSRQYVEKAVKSILGQSYSSFELIIMDDQSEDGTSELLRKLASGDSRIIVIRNQQWQGVTRSLNIGLSRARGHFIARQDADDWSVAGRFESQLAYLQGYPDLALAGTWVTKVDHEGTFLEIKEWPTEPDQIKKSLLRKNVIAHGSVLGRRELFNRCGGYREVFEVSQDRDLWLRAAEQFRLGNVPKPLYSLRIHRGSVSANRKQAKRITGRVIHHCVRMREKEGIDAFGARYSGPLETKQKENTMKSRSYRLLLALPENAGLKQTSKNVGTLLLCILLWPENNPAWKEMRWIIRNLSARLLNACKLCCFIY
jgi:glycosyltransferase involved in cell wall biosynthesis